jgi:hypothetical protein
LLRLLKRNRAQSLPHAEMVAGLQASDLVVSQSLAALNAAGLVLLEDGAARYAPATPALDRLFEEAETLYAKRPDAVRRTIVSAANPGIAAFADAFRLRGD